METAIRWSPSSTLSEQRFLLVDVIGRSFKRCTVQQYFSKTLRYEIRSTYSQVQAFRAFDWAPHDEALVAVGQWSGEVNVLRIDDASPNVSLPAKHQRLCNAVAFSRTGLLAAGLERVRNDFCLNIWDINQRFASVVSPGSGAAKPFIEPHRKFASSEAISSIKFFTGQPEVLVTGVKGRGVRIYDLRENAGSPSLHFQTNAVFNIAIDPLDENYFACAGGSRDTTIQIWDCRSGTPYQPGSLGSGSEPGGQVEGPVIQYAESFDTTKTPPQRRGSEGNDVSIWSLKYCKGRSGYLGALASNGDFKVFETKHEYSSLKEQYTAQQHADYHIPNTTEHSIFTKRIHHVEHARDETQSQPQKARIAAFDFTNLAGSKGTPCAILLRGDQCVEILELDGAPSALSVSSSGSVIVSKVRNTSMSQSEKSSFEDPFLTSTVHLIKPRPYGSVAGFLLGPRGARATNQNTKESHIRDGKLCSSREAHEEYINSRFSDKQLSMAEALTFSTVSRGRCAEGYLFDCKKNIEIVRDDPGLQKMWTWISRAKTNAENEGMITEMFDLSFFGVSSIWNNDLDSQRTTSKSSKPTYSKEIAASVETLCERLDLPDLRMTQSSVPNHRRLCLHICGLGMPLEKLENTVKDLVRDGQNTRAAALAMIHDQAKLAFQALREGRPTSAHRELSIALAGYNKGITDDTWEETIRILKNDLDDPYGRSILALVSYGDWHDVLAETSLPLRDRLGIALLYLNDEELTQYINENTAESVKEGDIEGVVLTGLTEQAVPLFENYIHKFSDLQTAVLAMSFASPRYFTDIRVDKWRETYRSYLNDSRMFIARVKFDVQSTKLSTPPQGKPLLAPPPRQVSLRCNNCDQALDRSAANAPRPEMSTIFGTHQGSIFGDDKSGTVCPRCGRHLPRCVVCMFWLGMPDPHSRGTVAKGASKEEALKRFVSVCRSCWHMSHSGHAQEWFSGHDVCAVPDCDCRCMELDSGPG